MPADTCRIKNHLSAAERGNPRSLRIPLVPADLHADARIPRIEIWKTEIAGREIKLFVVQRIVGDVHLSVFPEKTSVGVKHRARVVINARRAPFEQGNNQRYFLFLCNLGEKFGRWSGHGFRHIKRFGAFLAANVYTVKQSWQRK